MSFDHIHRAITADSIILSKAKADAKYAGLIENMPDHVGTSDEMLDSWSDKPHSILFTMFES